MNEKYIFLMDINDQNKELKQLAVNSNQLKKMWDKKEVYERGIKDINDGIISNKYSISYTSDSKENKYQIEKLLEYFCLEKPMNIKYLKKIKDVVNNGHINADMVGYMEVKKKSKGNEIDKELSVDLYELSDSNVICNRFFCLNNTKSKKVEIKNDDNILYIPYKKRNCVASFYIKNAIDENKKEFYVYTVKIYDADKFDEILGNSETQRKCIDNTLNKFQQGNYSVTEEGYSVSFKESNLTPVGDFIEQNKILRRSFVNYTDNSNRQVKKTSISKLEEVLGQLKDKYTKDGSNGIHKTDEIIPKIDKKNKKIEVSQESIPVFSALLEDSIFQRLLSGRIIIPYYEKFK